MRRKQILDSAENIGQSIPPWLGWTLLAFILLKLLYNWWSGNHGGE